MFTNARTAFRIFGIDVRIDPSWLLIAALITWSLARQVFPVVMPGETGQTHLIMAIVAMLLFFASLLAHELAHAMTARRFGIRTEDITLFLFGGVAEFAGEPRTPGQEFWVALAGPAMSVALSVVFWMAAGLSAGLSVPAPTVVVLTHLGLINLVLAIFNLLPAFPLDGGRVLRAWLWKRSGDILSATETSARVGGALAYALILIGTLALFQGGLVGGLWQILIGLFLLAAGRGAVASQRTKSHLGARTVRQLMTAPAITADPDTTLATLVNQIMLRHRVSFVPVVEDGVLLGHITTGLLGGIDRENWANTQVDDVFVSLDESLCVAPDMPALTLFQRMSETGERKFMVVENGTILGVVSLSDTIRLLGVLTALGNRTSAPRKAA